MKPRYTEHKLIPPCPERLEICDRCRRCTVLDRSGEPHCTGCPENEPGVAYIRADVVKDLLAIQGQLDQNFMVMTLEDWNAKAHDLEGWLRRLGLKGAGVSSGVR